MIKTCVKCKIEKPTDKFFIRKDSKEGLRSDCKECSREANRKSYHKYIDERRIKHNEYYAANSNKILMKQKQYAKDNPEKINAISVKYQAAKSQRVPQWLTKEQHKSIEQFYADAKTLSKKSLINFEVDHIVPLRGKNVSGLHVPWNLQIITESENIKKGNKFHG